VLDCNGSGTLDGVLAGIEWVTNNAVLPAVANLSLGGGATPALDDAVNNSVDAGVFHAVAAGNEGEDACNSSPARADGAFTVGATTSSDARAWFSNYGSCVDILAPGSDITSAWASNDKASNTISGTSMASPHVAGVAALVYDENPTLTVAEAQTAILAMGTHGEISGVNGSPNILLFSRTSQPSDCTAGESPEVTCDDGIDNDCDGYTDSQDTDCGGGEPPSECRPDSSPCFDDPSACCGFCFFIVCIG
jgi:subtilisin family serine protease